jgi:hypothetical protein
MDAQKRYWAWYLREAWGYSEADAAAAAERIVEGDEA